MLSIVFFFYKKIICALNNTTALQLKHWQLDDVLKYLVGISINYNFSLYKYLAQFSTPLKEKLNACLPVCMIVNINIQVKVEGQSCEQKSNIIPLRILSSSLSFTCCSAKLLLGVGLIRTSYRYFRYSCIYIAHMSPTLIGSSTLQRVKLCDALKIRVGIIFDFYPGLPHIYYLVGEKAIWLDIARVKIRPHTRFSTCFNSGYECIPYKAHTMVATQHIPCGLLNTNY